MICVHPRSSVATLPALGFTEALVVSDLLHRWLGACGYQSRKTNPHAFPLIVAGSKPAVNSARQPQAAQNQDSDQPSRPSPPDWPTVTGHSEPLEPKRSKKPLGGWCVTLQYPILGDRMCSMHRHPDHAKHAHETAGNNHDHSHPHLHATHPAIVKRLRRAMGHLGTVIEMIESHRPCLELAQQLHAVENAIASAKKTLIHDHIDHCLDASIDAGKRGSGNRQSLDEFKEITKYL